MAIASLSISDIYGTLIDKNVPIKMDSMERIANIYFDDDEWVVRAIIVDNNGNKLELEENLDDFSFDWIEKAQRKEILDKIFILMIDKVWKNRKENIIEELLNNEDKEFDNKKMAEVLNENDWQYYTDRGLVNRNGYYVKNVKGKGFPDYDKIVDKLSEKLKKSKEEIKKEISQEKFDTIFWDEVGQEVDDNNIAVVGRSGGYWGIEFDPDLIEIDKEKYEKEIEKIFNTYRSRSLLTIVETMTENNVEDEIYNLIRSKFETDLSVYEPTKEAKEKIRQMDKIINNIIKEFEKPDMWVNIIISTCFE
jgi:uncharacterized membrane protein YheB (UPF0754 family)